MIEVVVYGTIALDRFLPAGVELPGGEAFNTALHLANWGISVGLVGTTIGTDPEGARLWQLLEQTKIEPRYLSQSPEAVTPLCEITVAPDGERTMRGRGFDRALAPQPPATLFKKRPLVAVDPNLGAAATAFAKNALEFGCPLIAMDLFRPQDVVAQAQILQCSPESLRRFSGPTGTPEAILAALPARVAILTLGASGGLVRDGSNIWSFSALSLADIVDTTGAGDAFRAGLCLGYLRGWALETTVTFASAAAACHCRRLGGASCVPLEEIEALLVKNSLNFSEIL